MFNPKHIDLINYLGTHFEPITGSYNFALFPKEFDGIGWSLEELHTVIMEARKQDIVTIGVTYSKCELDQNDELIVFPEDLRVVGLTTKGHKLFKEINKK